MHSELCMFHPAQVVQVQSLQLLPNGALQQDSCEPLNLYKTNSNRNKVSLFFMGTASKPIKIREG